MGAVVSAKINLASSIKKILMPVSSVFVSQNEAYEIKPVMLEHFTKLTSHLHSLLIQPKRGKKVRKEKRLLPSHLVLLLKNVRVYLIRKLLSYIRLYENMGELWNLDEVVKRLDVVENFSTNLHMKLDTQQKKSKLPNNLKLLKSLKSINLFRRIRRSQLKSWLKRGRKKKSR